MLTTQFKDITYKSERDLWTLESKIYHILDWKWNFIDFDYQKDLIKISEKLSLYKLWLSNYLLESNDRDYLESLKEGLLWNWVEILWNFEKNWKFYLILYKPEIDGWIKPEMFDDTRNWVQGIIEIKV